MVAEIGAVGEGAIAPRSVRHLLHAHSTWSYDGRIELDTWATLARRHRCAAVWLTEHEADWWSDERYREYVEACRAASRLGVRVVPGMEFSQDGYHLLCYGLEAWPSRPCSVTALVDAVHQQGCLVALAHPPRYRWRVPGAILEAVDAVEVWNSHWACDGTLGPHPLSLRLATRHRLVVGQDVHKPHHVTSLFVLSEALDLRTALWTGEFAVELAGQARSCTQLREEGLETWLQRPRTQLLRLALRSHRLYRKVTRAWRR